MSLPIVAIVGRPNVGKSSLFNWLAGRRIAIVDPTAGVTRDRVATVIARRRPLLRAGRHRRHGHRGRGQPDRRTSSGRSRSPSTRPHVVLFVVDARDGVAPLDEDVAERLRDVDKPVVFVANKCDTPKLDPQTRPSSTSSGYGEPICVSAEQNRGRDELLDAVLDTAAAGRTAPSRPRDGRR